MAQSNADPLGLMRAAQAAYGRRDFAAAEAACSQLLLARPTDVPGTFMLALVCARTGRKPTAIGYLRDVLKREPAAFEAHVAISTLLFDTDQPDEARIHGKRAIELQPDDPETHAHFGRDLASHGFQPEAVTMFQQAVKLQPANLVYARDLATLLTSVGKIREAITAWENIVARAPDDVAGWLALGRLRLVISDSDGALACGTAAIRCAESSPEAHLLLAIALSEKGLAERAEPHLRRAVELKPNDPIALASLGLSLQEQGRFEEARQPLEKSIQLWPTNGLAHYTLFRTRRVTQDDAGLLVKLASLSELPEATPLDRSYLHYALAKGWEDLRDYEQAMGHYDIANSLAHDFWFKEKPWDRVRYRTTFDRTIQTFTPELVKATQSSGLDSSVPLLIVGMIRSGTTLVEQIVSSHPEIAGGGELTFWHENAGAAFDPVTGTVNEERLAALALRYSELLRNLSATAKRVTDKLPHNYAMLGLVCAAFPNARVIHVRRNPLDNCLSVYTTAYQRPPSFTLKRENIVLAYQEYRRMIAHWRRVLSPGQLLEVDYEDLIANRAAVTRRMIEFAGVEWDDVCLHHENNSRTVNTPSAWQVRQPIYSTSIERWRKFEPWLGELGELRDLLGE